MHFTESHEWVKVVDSVASVGVSKHAQKELGDIVHVELPQVGATVDKGQEMAVLESTKAAADVYAPISGKITEVNSLLVDHPEIINESAEDKAWLVRIEMKDPSELESLMDLEKYEGFVS